jgi:hypothetical protein
VAFVQPQTSVMPGLPPPHVWGEVQLPQFNVGTGQPGWLMVPQLSPAGHAVRQPAGMHVPAGPHTGVAPEQVPQATWPPQPSACVPQVCPPVHVVTFVQPQTFGVPGLPPPHVRPVAQVPQLTAGQPAGVTVPQLSPAGQVVGQLAAQVPEVLQVVPVAHAPQEIVPPQPSGCVPQVCPPVHAVALVQPQTFGIPGLPAPHVRPVEQVPQLRVGTGQPGWLTVPQLSPAGHAVRQPAGMQEPAGPQTGVEPAQVPQVTVPPQPSDCVPQVCPPVHVVAFVQPQTFVEPGLPPPQV